MKIGIIGNPAGKLLVYRTKLNGKKFNLLIDTGASCSFIDTEFANENKLVLLNKGKIIRHTFCGEKEEDLVTTNVEILGTNSEFQVIDIGKFIHEKRIYMTKIHGFLGLDVMIEASVVLDILRKQLLPYRIKGK